MKILRALNNGLLRLLDATSILLMVGMVIFLLIQLVMRFVFKTGLHWTEESAKICLIMLAYISASMTSLSGVHVNVTILSDLAKGTAKKVLFTFQQLVAIVFLIMVIVYSFPALEIASKSVTTNTQINNAVIYAIVPISCVIMVFGHLAKIVNQFTAKMNNDAGEGGNGK